MNSDEVKDARAALNAVSEQFKAAAREAMKPFGILLCLTCGEERAEEGQTRCKRCRRNMEEDRLNRELGQ